MRRILFALIAATLAASGCAAPITAESAAEKLNEGLAVVGEGVVGVLDAIHEADYPGGPFENNLDSARAYALAQLEEKYGEEFTVVGEEDLENYGLFAGASYTCEVAPAARPEETATAFVSQSRYRNVRDDYAVHFFAEAAQAPVEALCRSKDYVLDQRVSLEMPETERAWKKSDPLDRYLSESGAYVKATLRLPDGLDARTYAGYIRDFMKSVEKLNCDVLLQAKADKTYIFHRELDVLNGFSAEEYDLDRLEEQIREDMEIGGPRAFSDGDPGDAGN